MTPKPATPLPWESSIAGHTISAIDVNGSRYAQVAETPDGQAWNIAIQDAAYIVRACNSLPALEARVKELEAALNAIVKECGSMANPEEPGTINACARIARAALKGKE